MSKEVNLQTLLRWYEQMWTIRYFEEYAIGSYRKGLFGGSTHPCICQEAICVGSAAALEPTDQVLATYRGHGHAIQKRRPKPPLAGSIQGEPVLERTPRALH